MCCSQRGREEKEEGVGEMNETIRLALKEYEKSLKKRLDKVFEKKLKNMTVQDIYIELNMIDVYNDERDKIFDLLNKKEGKSKVKG